MLCDNLIPKLIIFLQFAFILPYSESVPFHLIGQAATVIFVIALLIKKDWTLSFNEAVFVCFLLIIPIIYWFVQVVILNKPQIIKNIITCISLVVTSYYINKTIGFYGFIKCLNVLVIISIFMAFIWIFFGELVSYQGLNNGTIVLEFLGAGQKVYLTNGELFGFSIRPSGLTRNPNNFAYMAAIMIMGISFFKEKKKKYWLVFIISILLTQSRSALVVVSVFYCLRYVLADKISHAKIFFSIGLLLFFIFINYMLLLLRDESDLTTGRLDSTLEIYHLFMTSNVKEFICGCGFGQLGYYLPEQLGQMITTDNTYIILLCELGIIGIIIIGLCFIVSSIVSCRKNNMSYAYLFCIMIYALFENILYENPNAISYLVFMFSAMDTEERNCSL